MNRSPTDEFQKECDLMLEFQEDPALGFLDDDMNESQESEWLGSADTEQSAILKNLGQEFELALMDEIALSDNEIELPESKNYEFSEEYRVKLPDLKNLGNFSRAYMGSVISSRRMINCTDLAVEIWIKFWVGLAQFSVKDPSTGRYVTLTRGNFRSTNHFINHMQSRLRAQDLIRQTYSVPGGHWNAVPGDVILWWDINNKTGRYFVNTNIVNEVSIGRRRSRASIRVLKGGSSQKVPEYYRFSADYFTKPIQWRTRKHTYTRCLVGGGPRRHIGFRHLR